MLRSPLRFVLAALAGAALTGAAPWDHTVARAQSFEKPIRVIVGFKAGGRTDTIARLITKKVEEKGLIPQPFVIVNVPGGGGAVAGREILTADPDCSTIGHWHHQMLIGRAMENFDFGPEDFASIGYTGGGSPVWTVREDSEFQTLEQLIDHLKAEPKSLVEVVGIGTIPHFVGALLAQDAGFETRKVSAQSGADRIKMILGGNADISLFAASEYLNWKDADPGLRALVFFGPERIDAIPDVPTAKELGYDVVWANPAWWLAPKDTPQDCIDELAAAFEQAIADPEIQKYYRDNALDPYWTPGDAAREDSNEMLERLMDVAETIR